MSGYSPWPTDPDPPTISSTYSVFVNLSSNAWTTSDYIQIYYTWDQDDYRQRKQRADHTNFMDKNAIVSLYFVDSKVYYFAKTTGSCCVLYTRNMQVSPTWLKEAEYGGTETIQGVSADVWTHSWYTWYDAQSDTTPLGWSWQLGPVSVNADFFSFDPSEQPSAIFSLPWACSRADECQIPEFEEAMAGIWI